MFASCDIELASRFSREVGFLKGGVSSYFQTSKGTGVGTSHVQKPHAEICEAGVYSRVYKSLHPTEHLLPKCLNVSLCPAEVLPAHV